MRKDEKPENTEKSENDRHHPSNSFYRSGLLYCSTGRGIGGMSLPLSREIVATNISLDDSEGAILEARAADGKTKNASFEVSNSGGFDSPICADRS